MRLERGLLRIGNDALYVYAVGKIYSKVNIKGSLTDNQKILGMDKYGNFDTCFEFRLVGGKTVYGFILKEDLSAMAYLILPVLNYVPHEFGILKEYQTGEEMCLIFNEIDFCEPAKF